MNILKFTPVTVFKLGVVNGLDTSQKHQLQMFDNVSAQTSFFNSKMIYVYNGLTPLKFSGVDNVVKLPVNADLIQHVNYCMFENENFRDKWYYAFVSGIKAISPNACEVTLRLDVWQTWYFDIFVQPSFVKREHVNNDTIGLHTIPEGLEHGDYIILSDTTSGHFGNLKPHIATTLVFTTEDAGGDAFTVRKPKYSDPMGRRYSNVPCSCNIYQCNNGAGVGLALSVVNDKGYENGVISTYLVPGDFTDVDNSGAVPYLVKQSALRIYTYTLTKNYANINGYTPKNNKLFVSPYNILAVTDFNGNEAKFNYEDFSTSNCQFHESCTITPNPQGLSYPMNYKGVANNYTEAFAISGFPQIPYNVDSYRAWLAQTQSSRAVANIATVASAGLGVAGVALGGPLGLAGVGALVSSASSVAGVMAQKQDHAVQPPQMRGNISSDILTAETVKQPHYLKMCIKKEYAKQIDDYFSMFGYEVDEIKYPNLNGRQSWNYVETKNAVVKGNLPNDARIECQNNLDAGITFWHVDDIGNYMLSNNIV